MNSRFTQILQPISIWIWLSLYSQISLLQIQLDQELKVHTNTTAIWLSLCSQVLHIQSIFLPIYIYLSRKWFRMLCFANQEELLSCSNRSTVLLQVMFILISMLGWNPGSVDIQVKLISRLSWYPGSVDKRNYKFYVVIYKSVVRLITMQNDVVIYRLR